LYKSKINDYSNLLNNKKQKYFISFEDSKNKYFVKFILEYYLSEYYQSIKYAKYIFCFLHLTDKINFILAKNTVTLFE